jgi:tol-pal system protein YbgF
MIRQAAMFSRLKAMMCAAVLIAPAQAFAQYQPTTEADAVVRVEQLENRLRQLTGENEQLQFRVRQLEDQLRAQGGGAAAPAARPNTAMAQPQRQPPPQAEPPLPAYPQREAYPQQPYQQQQAYPQQQPTYQQPQQAAAQPGYPQAAPGRRGDAFDPNANPQAPGVPRPLGSIVGQPSAPERPDVGAPGGRGAGEPLDLANMQPRRDGQPQPQPPAQPPAGPTVATAPQAQTPREEFDLGYGYIQRKDYALAEESLRGFVKKHPNDRLVADAQYWLGESLFQRQRYRDAAESFLTVTTKYDTATRAPDALLRLGQSLAALKEKEAACAAYGEVTRKYPRASSGVKQGVDREQKKLGC